MFNCGAMKLHERMCKKNPKNKHKCFQYCKHLIKAKNSYGETTFSCDKNPEFSGKELHSYKLERYFKGRERIKKNGLTRMPLKCEFYEIEPGHDEEFINELNK